MTETPGTPAPRRRGRPARAAADGGPGARERIVAAARAEFAEHGYDKASIRGIARGAGVDPALVHHYFGPKEQVFAAAVEVVAAPVLEAPDIVLAGGRDEVGERLTRFFLGVWDNPVSRAPLLAVVRSAIANETAAAIFRDLLSTRLMARIADGLDIPDARLRAELAASQLVGAALLRYVIRIEPLASADVEQVVAMLAPAVQRHLTGE
ncbi:TetR family transcriptional regulator [Streptomyces morookaense]|uniref:TetR/AcrR family transcriptional regulator n=1 Tax=Streptomyces morookaense TaxID=1970 RepID=A0A7Y7E8K0_STRMO|nr:TetR family transcriptional regulator [Streptomyces morookaense]NVK80088.1 TetR/AcrR family transcriptional regulator [Streptomyces morookaense]GHF29784.1 TetR family transcriptional regulator [Streptomyces morookaense]